MTVEAETGLHSSPGVVVPAAGHRAHLIGLHVYARKGVRVGLESVSPADAYLAKTPTARVDDATLRLTRVLRQDVDDAVDRVGAPQAPARASHDFDAVEIVKEDVLGMPVHTTKRKVVDRPAVNHDEELIGELSTEAAGAHPPCRRLDPRHVHPRHVTQCVRQRVGAAAPDIVFGQHGDGRRGVEEQLWSASRRGDLDLRELFEREVGEDLLLVGRCLCADTRGQQDDCRAARGHCPWRERNTRP